MGKSISPSRYEVTFKKKFREMDFLHANTIKINRSKK